MTKDTITQLSDPSGSSRDPITHLIRDSARKTLLAVHAGEQTEDGCALPVRHGHLPECDVMAGVGPVTVKVLRVRDRGDGFEKVKFAPSILPR